MSVLDTWFTGLQTAATSIATAVAGAVGAWLALRKRVSSDSADIRRTHLEMGWIERLVKKSEDDDRRIESLRESQLNDARMIAKKDAEAEACRERMQEAKVERESAMEELQQALTRAVANEALVLALRDEVLDYKLANGRLFKELSHIDPDAAERLLVAHLRPAPPLTGADQP